MVDTNCSFFFKHKDIFPTIVFDMNNKEVRTKKRKPKLPDKRN